MSKRFIITLDEDTGEFGIETPDGYIAYDPLVAALDATLQVLMESSEEEDPDSLDDDEEIVVEHETDPKKLN